MVCARIFDSTAHEPSRKQSTNPLSQAGCAWDARTSASIAARDDVDTLIWASENGCKITADTWKSAIEFGDRRLLDWLEVKHNPFWNTMRSRIECSKIAAHGGNIVALTWMDARKLVVWTESCWNALASTGVVDHMRWALTNYGPKYLHGNAVAPAVAAKHGHVGVMGWLDVMGLYQPNSIVLFQAARHRRYDALAFAFDTGCVRSVLEICREVFDTSDATFVTREFLDIARQKCADFEVRNVYLWRAVAGASVFAIETFEWAIHHWYLADAGTCREVLGVAAQAGNIEILRFAKSCGIDVSAHVFVNLAVHASMTGDTTRLAWALGTGGYVPSSESFAAMLADEVYWIANGNFMYKKQYLLASKWRAHKIFGAFRDAVCDWVTSAVSWC
jgi:hypothetical protein